MEKMLHNENETAEEKLCLICKQRHTDGNVDESVWEENYPDDETAFELSAKADGQEIESICIRCRLEIFERNFQIEENLKMQELEHKYVTLLLDHANHYQYEMQEELEKKKKYNYVGPQIPQKVFKQMLNQTIKSLNSIKDEFKAFNLEQNSKKAFVKSKWKNHLADKKKGKKK